MAPLGAVGYEKGVFPRIMRMIYTRVNNALKEVLKARSQSPSTPIFLLILRFVEILTFDYVVVGVRSSYSAI